MAIFSMTGFARSQGEAEGCAWTWELKSVNGKGLDVRTRVPSGFDDLEPKVRKAFADQFARGNIAATLILTRADATSRYTVNRELLADLTKTAIDLHASNPEISPATADGLMALRGVIEVDETGGGSNERDQLDKPLLESLGLALNGLGAARREEGAKLEQILVGQLAEIARFCGEIEGLSAAQPEAIRRRMAKQIQTVMDNMADMPQERLAQEAALLMTKADIREEIDRLKAHLEAAYTLMAAGSPVGRKLDFLCQEFNREANTLCSKSQDVALTRTGLALKATIDQMREQVQNIE